MEQSDKTIKNTQKILNKLISEEVIAANIYMGAVNNVKPEYLKFIADKFSEIAKDEMEDHWKSLVNFAKMYGFEVPFKFKDIEKYASSKMVAKLNHLKNKEDGLYYVQKAIESEHDAIQSFEEAMQSDYMYDLQPILLKCYYDELQHLEDLELLMKCMSIGVMSV